MQMDPESGISRRPKLNHLQQFGLMKGKGTTDAICIEDRCRRSLELKERSSILALWIWKKLLKEVIRWAIRKLGIEEWLVSAVISVYTGAKTVVRTVYGNSNGFEVKVGMYQGSA